MNSDGTNQQRLTFNEAYNDDPAWSRHDRIIYESDQDGRFNIYQLSPQGGTPQLLISLGESATTPAWSADGQWLAFESREGEARHLWIATGEGANQQRVTAEGSNNQRPAWSPDGTRLAFHSNYQQPNDSLADIWTIHRETKALQRLTFRGDCLNPAWSRPGASATPGSTDSTANVAVSSDITSWPISETGVDWVGGGRLRPNRALPLAGYGNHAC
jgi:Tol biopolymer transport system component